MSYLLGIEIDTMAGALWLPMEKLTRIRHTLHGVDGGRAGNGSWNLLLVYYSMPARSFTLGDPSCGG